MGTLFWQLNDCWPAVSWSTVDYYGRWKAAQYKVREKYRNIFWDVQEKDGSRQLFLQSDSLQDVHGRIQVEMYAPDGSRLIDVHYAGNIVLKAGEKYIVHRFTEQELGETTKNERVVWAGFHSADGKLISETVYWPAVPKDTRLQKPVINVQAENGYVVFTTNVPAKDVFWEIEGYDGNLEDNFFDLLPGHAKKIRLPQQLQPGKNIVPLIRVKSLYDVLYAR
jgi:beta-mannosidase